ncbi:hypothetical protein BDZ45DRAFT_559196, partial [Acephala macrosclerotiorum]
DPLQCHLRIASLADMDTIPPYAAISYTWGDDMSDRPIYVDGRRLSVKPNLKAALLEFRRQPPQPVLLWIDGICINQKDTDERDSQVQIMAKIYAKADYLVVWLGVGDRKIDICL